VLWLLVCGESQSGGGTGVATKLQGGRRTGEGRPGEEGLLEGRRPHLRHTTLVRSLPPPRGFADRGTELKPKGVRDPRCVRSGGGRLSSGMQRGRDGGRARLGGLAALAVWAEDEVKELTLPAPPVLCGGRGQSGSVRVQTLSGAGRGGGPRAAEIPAPRDGVPQGRKGIVYMYGVPTHTPVVLFLRVAFFGNA